MKKVKLTATVDEELLAKLQAMAVNETRTLSNLVETLLYKAINDKK